MAQTQSKTRKNANWIIPGILFALFAFSSFGKLSGAEQMVTSFDNFGLADMRIVIGTGELGSAILYLVPLTSSLGVLLLSAYMGGAILAHMSHDESYLIPAIVLLLVWAGQYLRYPDLLVSFNTKKSAE